MSLQLICQTQNCIEKANFVCCNCQKSYYCSQKHQKDNWKIHRHNCGQLPIPEFDRPNIRRFEITNTDNIINDLAMTEEQLEDSEQQNDRLRNHQSRQERKMRRQQEARKKQKQNQKNAIIKEIRTPDVQARGADLKRKLDQRQIDRAGVLFHYFNSNYQNALLSIRRITLVSQRITTQINSSILVQLEYKYFIKTSKLLQQIQYLFDTLLLIRLLSSLDKVQDIKDTIRKLKFPTLNPPPAIVSNFASKEERIQFNTWRKQVTHLQCILKSIFQVIAKKQMTIITQKVLEKYVEVVQFAYGDLQLASAYFMIGVWHADFGQTKDKNYKATAQYIRRITEAKKYFGKCLEIRQKFGDSLPLSDVLLNLAMVEWNISGIEISDSIDKIQRSLKIRKNIIAQPSLKFTFSMQLLGRLYMLSGQFQKSFSILFECLKLQEILYSDKDQSQSVEQKTKIQILLIFLYKNLNSYIQKQPNINQADQLKKLYSKIKSEVFEVYQQFQNYAIDESDLVDVHFKMTVSDELFQALSAREIEQLSRLLNILETMTYFQGLNHFKTSGFFQKLDKQKKTMILISNPSLDKSQKKSHTPKSVIKK